MGVITATLAINGTSAWTSSPDVTLTLTASSTGGAVTRMRFSNDGTTFSPFEPFATTKMWTLAAGADGMRTVTVELEDVTAATALRSDTIGLDTSPPTITALTINGGAVATSGLTLSMASTASDVAGGSGLSSIEFSLDELTWSTPQTWLATVGFNVPAGDGPRTYYARVRDGAGNVSLPPHASDSIYVDQTAPTVGSVLVNAGAASTGSTGVLLTISGTDTGSGLRRMCVKSGVVPVTFVTPNASDGCWVPYGTMAMHTLVSMDGTHRVHVWFEDFALNVNTTPATDEILLDRSPPTGTVVINGNAAATSSTAVTLSITAADSMSGIPEMCVQSGTMPVTFMTPGAADACWIPFANTQPWTLAATADGNQRVSVWFKDATGNISAAVTDDIFLDRQAPTAPLSLTLVSVTGRTVRVSMTYGVDAMPAATPLGVQLGYRLNGSTGPYTFAPGTMTSPVGNVTISMSRGNSYELVARMVDGAGNVSGITNSIVATTRWLWEPRFHMPWAEPFSAEGSAVFNGTHVVMSNQADMGAWIDNGDGFQTMRRLDATGYTVVSVPGTSRGIIGSPVQVTNDMGTTWWPVSGSFNQLYAGAFIETTTGSGGATVDTYLLGGQGGSLFRVVVTGNPGFIPMAQVTSLTSPTGDLWEAITVCSGCSTGTVVATARNLIVRSTNGGQSWSVIPLPGGTLATYDQVVSVPGTQIMYAAGYNSVGLIRSLDGGLTWTQVGSFSFSLTTLGIAGSGAGYTLWIGSGLSSANLRRYDGTTFTTVSLAALGTVSGMNTMSTIGYGATAQLFIGAENGELVHVSQNGAAVARRSRGEEISISALRFVDGSDQQLFMVAGQPRAWRTTDRGLNWTVEALPGNAVDVYAFSDGTAVAVGSTSISARSASGMWTAVASGTTQSLTGVSCRGLAGCLISGNANTVLAYDPVTQTVTPLLGGSGNAYNDVFTWVDTSAQARGIVVGQNGAVRTCIGCTTASSFTPETLLPPAIGSTTLPTLYAVAARPGGRIVAVGDPGTFGVAYTSSDFGMTWVRNGSVGGFATRAVVNVADTNTWYTGSSLGGFSVSTNDGATWTSMGFTTWMETYTIAVPQTVGAMVPIFTAGPHGQVWYSPNSGL